MRRKDLHLNNEPMEVEPEVPFSNSATLVDMDPNQHPSHNVSVDNVLDVSDSDIALLEMQAYDGSNPAVQSTNEAIGIAVDTVPSKDQSTPVSAHNNIHPTKNAFT